jgi:hypothetical protein
MGFFSLSKGATTTFKPIYKCCGKTMGDFFSFFFKGGTTFVKSN